MPEQFHFAPGYGLAVVGWDSPEEHAAIVEPIRDGLPPLFEFVTPIPYAMLQQMLDDSAPWGILAYEKACYLDELTDDAIAVIADYLPRKASPMSIMPVFPMGGAYHDVADDDTAFGGSRAVEVAREHRGQRARPRAARDRSRVGPVVLGRAPAVRERLRRLRQLPSNDADDERVRASYGAAKYDRLARIKAQYDPDNVFHKNANIKPAVSV